MSKRIMFSRVFPAYHPRSGGSTGFVDLILTGEKKHTIRSGNRWKVGDKFSPRIWIGRPRYTTQRIIADDKTVLKIWSFTRDLFAPKFYLNGHPVSEQLLSEIAANDGLTVDDFKAWFNKPFEGQIICWNESVNYEQVEAEKA